MARINGSKSYIIVAGPQDVRGTLEAPLNVKDRPNVDEWVDKFGDHISIANGSTPDCWDLGTNSNVDVWYDVAGFRPWLRSTSTLDVGFVTLKGNLASDGTEATEDVAINGTDWARATNTYRIIPRMKFHDGPLSINLGNITAYKDDQTTAISYIRANKGQTLQAWYQIPTNVSSARLLSWYKEAGKADEINADILVAEFGSSWQVKHTLRGSDSMSQYEWSPRSCPCAGLELNPGDLVKVRLEQVADNVCAAGFNIAMFY